MIWCEDRQRYFDAQDSNGNLYNVDNRAEAAKQMTSIEDAEAFLASLETAVDAAGRSAANLVKGDYGLYQFLLLQNRKDELRAARSVYASRFGLRL